MQNDPVSKELSNIPISVLDLATIVEGDKGVAETFKRSLIMARFAESLGFNRYWFAEHHNMESVASSATPVLIGYVAGGTSSIRVGSGGIMLPNHAPLVVAEQFGTLEALYPHRIDLGIGRAPGTDQITSKALRRKMAADINDFPNDVAELMGYLGPKNPAAAVKAVPGQESHVPVWLLGSSTYSAQLAAEMGLPFAFASHFAPDQLMYALNIYRSHFKPSQYLQQPYAMACVNVIAADTDAEAKYLATSFQQLFLGIFRNSRHPLQPPVDSMDHIWSAREKAGVMHMLEYSFTGSIETVGKNLQSFLDETGVDEIMAASNIYDMGARMKSTELLGSLFEKKQA